MASKSRLRAVPDESARTMALGAPGEPPVRVLRLNALTKARLDEITAELQNAMSNIITGFLTARDVDPATIAGVRRSDDGWALLITEAGATNAGPQTDAQE